MPFLDCDFSIPKGVTDVSEILFLKIVKPEYCLIQVTQCGFFKQAIKPGKACYVFEFPSCLYIPAHTLLVFTTSGAS